MGAPAPQILSVTELTRRLKGLLEASYPSVWVEGEISNLAQAPSGHVYFTLKDAETALTVVVFRNAATRLGFALANGLQVLVAGRISVYEKRGQYQLIATQAMPKGLGALQLAFEQLKQKLAKEGLFDPDRKKPLPALPQRIGLVTSPTGAAVRDFLNIIQRRFPNVHVIINPVRVQGVGAAEEIAAAIDEFNDLHRDGRLSLDVLIVTRGGGSLEDLWPFNEEIVARSLAASVIPTLSAVGHEIDFTISDFVADLRAPTPSAAAELVVQAKEDLIDDLKQIRSHLKQSARFWLATAQQQHDRLAQSYVFRQPGEVIRQYQQQIDDLGRRLGQQAALSIGQGRRRLASIRLLSPHSKLKQDHDRLAGQNRQFLSASNQRLADYQTRLSRSATSLELLSPKSTLSRGYSITRLATTGAVVRHRDQVKPGDKILTLVLDGEFPAVVSSAPDLHGQ